MTVANWLVKLPHEAAASLPRRVSRFEYALHHTYCLLDEHPGDAALAQQLHGLARAQGVRQGAADSSGLTELIQLRHNAAACLSREGCVGIVWDAQREGSFFDHFNGLYLVLALHALAERVTLEKLSYLEALFSQHLPATSSSVNGDGSVRRTSPAQLALAREGVVALASMLVRYSSAMASWDCGGRPEHGEFLAVLRQMHNLAQLKQELGEEVQDMLSIVEREWTEARRRSKKKEGLWELRQRAIAQQISRTRNGAKLLSDVVSNALLGITFPITLGINLFSMNIDSLPREFPWSWVLIISGVFSGVMILVFGFVFLFYRRRLDAVKAEKLELLRERTERLRLTSTSLDNDKDQLDDGDDDEDDINGEEEGSGTRMESAVGEFEVLSRQERWSMDVTRKPRALTSTRALP